MQHQDIWAGIDALAARNGLSPSGLAKRAGLDPTAFNKSKRSNADGSKLRWPSTESLSKALSSVGASFDDFAALIEGRRGQSVPLIGFAQAGEGGYFDDAGFPAGHGWDEVSFPGLNEGAAYALEIAGDSMEPLYRAGDRIVVAPGDSIRRGDRVVAKMHSGEVLAKEVGRLTDNRVELISLNPKYPPRNMSRSDISWMARIVWASQ
ncbi:MAG: helix-turn-helix transcriptional regulator [Pseudomonadota bacterium]